MKFKKALGLSKVLVAKCVKPVLLFFGFWALLLSILAFTSFPYHFRYWLATHKSNNELVPQYILMLGGGGMPSEENLMRLYETAELGHLFPHSRIIIAHPLDTFVHTKMTAELINKGIAPYRINFEHYGSNTRSQVLGISDTFPETIHANIVLVTSPEQMLRSVLAFRKAGFTNVSGCPTLQHDMKTGLLYKSKLLGGKQFVPDVGENLALRYNFWNYLIMEIQCLRELCALFYYWLNGWI
jgi:uncharacterized SAM-binding protein YcdF (DUF218 family)